MASGSVLRSLYRTIFAPLSRHSRYPCGETTYRTVRFRPLSYTNQKKGTMKIRSSDILRCLQLARKYLKSAIEDDFQTVVFTSTQNSIAIAMLRDGLIHTYLCKRVDSETCEQVFGVPIGLLQDCSNGLGTVELCEFVENGDCFIATKWSDGRVLREQKYPALDPPDYQLRPDLAWHTIDARMVELQVSPSH